MEKLLLTLEEHLNNQTLISGVWSNPRKKQDVDEKCVIKPIILKETPLIQFTCYKDNKAYHHNIAYEACRTFIMEKCMNFKQLQLFTVQNDYSFLINKKGAASLKKTPATKTLPASFTHNRQKTYVLDDTNAKAFLIKLGLMSEDGKVKPSKYDKYKQINKYLETIETVMNDYQAPSLRIIDFGCGKSYLTFALYYYLTEVLNREVEIIGLDLKEDVIAFCNNLAVELGYTHLKFQVGDIGHYTTNKHIDMVISLHACNTATDAALSKAIGWDARIILAVPCCHHECYMQIENELLAPLLKHGILKERIAALVTDGLRAQMLEAYGYKVNVMEFIDMQHTPKNILIKAVKGTQTENKAALVTYNTLAQALHLDLSLPKFLEPKA